MTDYPFQQYIAGAWVEASNGNTWPVLNPATEAPLQTVPFGNADDANAAIEAAARAFPAWSAKTPYERGAILKAAADIMRQRQEDLARLLTQEAGKPLVEARAEWGVVADLFEWYAEEGKRAYGRVIPSRHANKRRMVIKQPIGVVGIIVAWNFPAYNPGRALSAALGAGCTVVLRPAEFTPLTAMAMTAILVEAGLPEGVLNLINGEAEAMGQAMLNHPALKKISFTGSTRVGKILMDGASRTHTRLGLELGGNAPVLIFPDADIEAVVQNAVTAKFRNAGQVCVSPQRFIVHNKVVEEFVYRASKTVQAMKLGDGLEPSTQMGPLINARQRERVEALVAQAVKDGAEVVTGGSRPAELRAGYFYRPTILASVRPENILFAEEIFGPVMPITPFLEDEEALHLANHTPYGLAAYIFTNNINTATHFAEKVHFGIVGVNDWYPWTTEAPFVGWGVSGLGAESGQEGMLDYMETKLITTGGL